MSRVGTCREITGILLAGEYRTMTRDERALLEIHLGLCDACVNFESQVAFLRQATRRWRAYRSLDDA